MVQDVQKREGVDESVMKQKFPLTYRYLLGFKELLLRRAAFRKYFCDERGMPFAPFYSLYKIGEYTLAPYEVCWREQAEFFTCAVTGNAKVAGKARLSFLTTN